MKLKKYFLSTGKQEALPYLISGTIGGFLMGLTVAPTNFWFLAWIALIPLWIALNRSALIAIATALIWGCMYHGIALFWITGIHPMTWMGVPWFNSLLIALFCWLFITAWGAILVIVWAYFSYLLVNLKVNKISLFNSLLFKIFASVSLWCLLEKIWSFGSLWWTSISFTQSPDNLALLQLLKLSGTTTITALIVLVNIVWAEAILRIIQGRPKSQFSYLLIMAFCCLLFTHLIGWNIYQTEVKNELDQQIKVGLIQGNIPNEIKLYDPGLRSAIVNYSQGYQELAEQNLDLIITPETALPFFYETIKNKTSFYELVKKKKIPIILGALKRINKQSYQNTLFMIDQEGEVISSYDKIKLVPLGEYVPFRRILGDFIDRLSPLDTLLIAGNSKQIFKTPFGKAIAGICYDSAFSEVFRQQALTGGEFIVTAANNAHYSHTMPAQHHAQDIMRAIETDRWMARVSNTGYSAIVDPRGNTIWRSDLDQFQTHQDIIYRRQSQTFYVTHGDWLSKVLAGVLVISVLGILSKE